MSADAVLDHPLAPRTVDVMPSPARQFRAAYFVEGRVCLSPPAESVSALFDLILADPSRRPLNAEPLYTHLVIFEPADLTVPNERNRS